MMKSVAAVFIALAAAAPALGVAAAAANEQVVGNVRVSALSATLLRVEPKGPMGFEDRSTFSMAGTRAVSPSPPALSVVNTTSEGTWLHAQGAYYVLLQETAASNDTCAAYQSSVDVDNPVRSPDYQDGAKVDDRAACCALCTADDGCNAWVFAGASDTEQPTPGAADGMRDVPGANCWPLSSYSGTHAADNREVGCGVPGCTSPITTLRVVSESGEVLFDQTGPPSAGSNLLHWPAPVDMATSYTLVDYPRFYAPEWGPTPIPENATVDPALVPTNGYDFRNNVAGDQYVFLLGTGIEGWSASRREFLALSGPTPLLPDFAFGTWFTWWHAFTEADCKSNVTRWIDDKLPIDVWALDMNWRNTSVTSTGIHEDHFYDYPATQLIPDFAGNSTAYFDWLTERNLFNYFNDHPFPVADQTTKEEVDFRWNGLSEWMARGLTYWWFDRNWGFSIPPPNLQPVGGWNQSHTGGDWLGLDNAAWGSHLYHTTVQVFDATRRPATAPGPITLTKFAPPDWRPGMDAVLHAESPSHHRYPVWWTGDGVPLQGSVQSMVQSGIYDFKPYVHSDCGGDYTGSGGDLLRWTAHCTFGTIFRYHGSDHRPWSDGVAVENTIRSYLNTRYKLAPSFVAAGKIAVETAWPLVARGDLFWPEQGQAAASDDQYIHLNDTLVAPIWDSVNNITSRDVWIPPGSWQDAWNGTTVTGPATLSVTQPYERIPMWHRAGGMTVITDSPGTRLHKQDWSALTVEAFPHLDDISDAAPQTTSRVVFDKSGESYGVGSRTQLTMTTTASRISVAFAPDADADAREWSVRVHLQPGQKAVAAAVEDESGAQASVDVVHVLPLKQDEPAYFPFGGVGAPPPFGAGPTAEVRVSTRGQAAAVHLNVVQA